MMGVNSVFFMTVVLLIEEEMTGINAVCSTIESGSYVVRRFGDDCKFMCHCRNNTQCDHVTGSCSGGCELGWYGPGCQYRNVIYKSFCKHIDNTKPTRYCHLANDDDTETCSMTANATSGRNRPPWWRGWIPEEEYITELSILTSKDSLEYFQGFEIFIENLTETEMNRNYYHDGQVLCYRHGKEVPDATYFTVVCDTPTIGNQVRIQLNKPDTQLVLCDVKINGGRNLAFQGDTALSSLESKEYPANNSVDGILGYDKWNSCTGTEWVNARTDQWWSLTLKNTMKLKRLILGIFSKARIENYQLLIQNANSSKAQIYDDTGQDPPTTELAFPDIQLTTLIIERLNVNRLVLCEVEVFGDCGDHLCGLECDKECHCRNTSIGDIISGNCSSGCQDGWKGIGKKCDKACTPGTFGFSCAGRCGQCKGTSDCHPINGTCLNGCKLGYTGLMCNEKCPAGTFGLDCNSTCSEHCQDISDCRNTDGVCTGGCIQGYTGDMCREECPSGTFGLHCNSSCSVNCQNSSDCRNTDGICAGGCIPGYTGEMCLKECPTGRFGLNCNLTCSTNCQNSSDCRNTDGICAGGCVPGFIGEMCLEACPSGTYGENCNYTCSQNCQNISGCRNIDGVCTGGCVPGFVGEKCLDECDDGFYGRECNSSCSLNCNGNQTRCGHVNGQCEFGCKEGWIGDTCHLKCQNKTYGLECNSSCGHCMNDTCHPVHGECLGGCLPGYTGSLCEAIISDTEDPAVVYYIVPAIVAVVLLVVVFSVLIRKKQTIKTSSCENQDSEIILATTSVLANELYNGTDNHAQDASTNIETDARSTGSAVDKEKTYANDENNVDAEDPVYCNVSPFKVRVTDLRQVIKVKTAASYQSEFEDMRSGVLYATTAAVKEGNYFKNKYKDIYAYDHTRVKLKQLHGDPDSDYINASNIRGHLKERVYIAAQGPIDESLTDFWRMIWEKDINVIIMLTNTIEDGKSKCLKYWGDIGTAQKHRKLHVTLQTEEKFAEFTIRRLSVTQHASKRTSRSIVQYHYTAWPDRGVPKTVFGLQHFWRKVRQNDENKAHAWLVHCSAGVGRTGTFIATDILYDQGSHTGHVNVHDCVLQLREQRPSMVQTKDQYVLLYSLVTEMFDPSMRPISVSKFVEHYSQLSANEDSSERTSLFNEYQALAGRENQADGGTSKQEKEAGRRGSETFTTAKLPENEDKNRFPDVLAPDEHRPILSLHVEGRTNYINAVYVPSYEDLQGYIISQLPMENTVIDFYLLIVDKDIGLIVTFPDEVTSAAQVKFLPEAGEMLNGPFQVAFLSETRSEQIVHRRYSLVYQDRKQTVDHLIYEDWPGDENTPSKETSMLQFMMQVQHLHETVKKTTTLVQCLDGAERSGLFVTLMNIADYAKFDKEVSIPMIVRHMRGRRSQIISSFEQYKFCYEVLCRQLECDTTYANL